MGDADPGHLAAKERLAPLDLAEIERLVALCQAHDGHSVKLNWRMMRNRPAVGTSDFCWYSERGLVGYAPLDAFGPEFELTGLVHPAFRRRGIFRNLVAAAVTESRRHGASRLLLVNVRDSTTGRAAVEALGPPFRSAEYHLELDASGAPLVSDSPLRLREAGPADLDALTRIMAACFAMPEDVAREDTLRSLAGEGGRDYLAEFEGEPVGRISAIIGASGVYLGAFGVLPPYRGRGHGRHILAATIERLRAEGQRHFALDVVTDNSNALALYESCGFRPTTVYDYYEWPLG